MADAMDFQHEENDEDMTGTVKLLHTNTGDGFIKVNGKRKRPNSDFLVVNNSKNAKLKESRKDLKFA